MPDDERAARFEQLIAPHLDAAHNLARWLTRNPHDAEDVVQEATMRAYRSLGRFQEGNSRAWLLTIVRNTCYTWLKANRAGGSTAEFDEEVHAAGETSPDPEALLVRSADAQMVREALEELPLEFREALVLRELEGMSYKEIAAVADIPMGTVMSRIARARGRLQAILAARLRKES